MKKPILILLVIVHSFLSLIAQHNFSFDKTMRYDENYEWLRNDTSDNYYKKMKYHSLSPGKSAYISLGGEIRYQYFYFKNEKWGEKPDDKDGYILTRYLVHSDVHLSKRFRFFFQLQSSFANGRSGANAVEENELEVHQAFAEFNLHSDSKSTLIARVGRQEYFYGTGRLITVRDGPNNRQSFDGAKFIYQRTGWKTDLFYSTYVFSTTGILNDKLLNNDEQVWGGYSVVNKVPLLKNIDIYYLGIKKNKSVYDDYSGKETRHSIGTRVWNTGKCFRYDAEGLYQFGKADQLKIAAWTVSVNAGYKLYKAALKPLLSIKTEVISGNKSYTDNHLETFNPLFPKGNYFGWAALIGPSNLFDIHPATEFEIQSNLHFNIDADFFWRNSSNDGIYGPNTLLIFSGKSVSEKFIGQQYSCDLNYIPNPFLYLRAELTWFKSGEYLKKVSNGENIIFTGITVQLKF